MKSIVNGKSRTFALRIVKLYKYLTMQKKEYVLSKQVLRSGTSIGANISEALYAQSHKDFLAKMYIALKEASETSYWLLLLHEAGYIKTNHFESINVDCQELVRLLSSITKTCKEKL